MRPILRGRFQFTVDGTEGKGVLYVHTARKAGESDDSMRARAIKMASKRAGDPSPKLIRDNLNGEVF